MMAKKLNKNGFVLITTLCIVGFLAFVTQQLLQRMMVHDQFDHLMLAREKAKMIAFGGISLAQMQLSERDFKNSEKTTSSVTQEQENKADEKIKKMLSTIVPHLNRWQRFPLTTTADGVEGELKICIMCEHGKLNINALFDFEKKEFSPLGKLFLGGLTITSPDPKERFKAGEFLKLMTDYLKKRGKPLDDISQLLEITKLGQLPLFYTPPEQPQKNVPAEARPFALSDIFTVWTPDEKIEPWMLSDALCRLFSVRRPEWNDAKTFEEPFKKAIAQFKRNLGTDWSKNWNILLPIYTKTPPGFNERAKILSQQFDPTVYTVISSGTVQGIEQKVLAVLMKTKNKSANRESAKKDASPSKQSKQAEEQQNRPKKGNEEETSFKIMKLYWL